MEILLSAEEEPMGGDVAERDTEFEARWDLRVTIVILLDTQDSAGLKKPKIEISRNLPGKTAR